MAPQSLAQRMAEAAADAVDLTEVYFSKTLDFSEASIAKLEQSVENVEYRMPGGATKENIGLLSVVWGAYIGEVFRRNVGGEWIEWEDQWGKSPALVVGSTKIFPQDKVLKRLTVGPEHKLDAYYRVLRAQMTTDA